MHWLAEYERLLTQENSVVGGDVMALDIWFKMTLCKNGCGWGVTKGIKYLIANIIFKSKDPIRA